MTEVEVISKCLVGAAATTAERSDGSGGSSLSRVDLTPWDLQLLLIGTIQKGLLFHKPTPQQEKQLLINSAGGGLIHHLKTSLSSALALYPPAAGRFATETNEENQTSALYVDCNNAGVEFVEAKATSATVAAILDPSNDDDAWKTIRSFFPLNFIRNWEGITNPLMGVQVTELLDGYFIACTLNHVLADGTAFWNFFHSWSEISRGYHQVSRTPVLERWFPDDTNPPIHLPLTFKGKTLPLGDLTPSPFPERMFRLAKEKITKLKEKANAEAGETAGSVSSLQAYMAHVWVCVTRARGLDGDADVQMSITIGTRARVPLPEGYWGNALYVKMVTAKAGELLAKGLGWAAWKIKETVQNESGEEVMNQYLSWWKSPVFLGEKKLFKAKNTLVIGSSPRHDIYSTDFGWGKAVAVRSGEANKSDGKVTLFEGSEEGSVDIELCIHPRTLLGLHNDPEFMEYVTVPLP
ncbi:hypothetical protein DM860_008850 [Cuscuta australis]|uniref:HXXXD-type acyl-transferase family protein n=1 Tax=Cuscuta australis TaxID=267555 RepID=A0A328DB40_9ASTE|nr:hypothetical protein DM860_008850 [Cuscuta australis]